MNWFGDDFRKVHVLYVSPDWATNRHRAMDPDVLIGKLKQAGCAAVEFYIKDHHGIAYYPTKIGHYGGRDLLRSLVEACHRQGRIVLKFYEYCPLQTCAIMTSSTWTHVYIEST